MRFCKQCLKTYKDTTRNTFCKCGGVMNDLKISIGNTRDSFGVGKEFYDSKTGKYINNWKSWEKAGFKDFKDVKDHRNDNLTKLTKEKMKSKPKSTKTPWLDYAERAI
jgi:hypothetical protein